MRITQEADYALRMVCHLAEVNKTVGASALAEAVAVPARFGLKILRKLSEAGLVESQRGAGGGYRLIRPPEDLTLRQVIEVIDGPIALRHCLEDIPCANHPSKDACKMHHLFGALNDLLIERLDRITVAMIADAATDTQDILRRIQ